MAASRELQILLRPWLFSLCTLAPQLLLIAGGWSVFSLIHSSLPPESFEIWLNMTAFLFASGVFFSFAVIRSGLNKQLVSWKIAPPYIFIYSLWLYLFFAYSGKLVPFVVPGWVLSEDDYLLAPATLLVPGILYAILVTVYRFTPKEARGWKSFGSAIAIVLGWYAAFHWRPLITLGHNDAIQFAVITSFAVSIVVFVFFLIRWMIIVARNPAWYCQVVGRSLFTLILPLVGLYLNSTSIHLKGVYGDFSHPLFATLAVVNGLLLIFPTPKEQASSLVVLLARITLFPFTAYFFLAFAPLVPFAFLACAVFGLGFIIITPSILFVIHTHDIAWQALPFVTRYSKCKSIVVGVSLLSVLPMAVLLSYFNDRQFLRQALAAQLEPDYETGLRHEIDTLKLEKLLKSVQSYKERGRMFAFLSHTPILDPLYKRIVFDNLTISDQTIDRLVEEYELSLPRRPQRRMPQGIRAKLTDASITFKATEGFVESTVELVLGASNNSPHEYVTEFRIPAGVWISNFTLRIEGKDVPGQLVEKQAAQWVYQQIVNQRKDPGLLFYTDANNLQLRVFPVLANDPRVVRITFLHRTQSTVEIDGRTFHLGAASVDSELGMVSGDLAFLTLSDLRKLTEIQRKPYFHFIIECEQSDNSWQADAVQNFLSSAGSMDVKDHRYLLGSQIFESGNVSVRSLQKALVDCRRSGKLDLDYALKSILLKAGRSHSSSYPVPVVVTKDITKVVKPAELGHFAALVPEFKDRIVTFDGTKQAVFDTKLTRSNDSLADILKPVNVRAWPSSEDPLAFLSNSSTEAEVFLFEKPSSSDNSSDSKWEAGLKIRGEWLRQSFFPNRTSNAQWTDLVRTSSIENILSPVTSFIVLETEMQREALRRKHEQRISGRKLLDASEIIRMDEPPLTVLLAMALLLGAFALNWQRRRRGSNITHLRNAD